VAIKKNRKMTTSKKAKFWAREWGRRARQENKRRGGARRSRIATSRKYEKDRAGVGLWSCFGAHRGPASKLNKLDTRHKPKKGTARKKHQRIDSCALEWLEKGAEKGLLAQAVAWVPAARQSTAGRIAIPNNELVEKLLAAGFSFKSQEAHQMSVLPRAFFQARRSPNDPDRAFALVRTVLPFCKKDAAGRSGRTAWADALSEEWMADHLNLVEELRPEHVSETQTKEALRGIAFAYQEWRRLLDAVWPHCHSMHEEGAFDVLSEWLMVGAERAQELTRRIQEQAPGTARALIRKIAQKATKEMHEEHQSSVQRNSLVALGDWVAAGLLDAVEKERLFVALLDQPVEKDCEPNALRSLAEQWAMTRAMAEAAADGENKSVPGRKKNPQRI